MAATGLQGRDRSGDAAGLRPAARLRHGRTLRVHRGDAGAEWAKLVKAHGGDESRARQRFAQRLAQQIDERGTVDVLRHGVRDQNVEIRLSYRRPAFGVAPELVAHYDANRLTVTRQLPFDPESNKTIDLCLFVNGIPVATAELKNHLTGQNIEHAIEQYRTDRDPKNVTLGRRALVHFAVDPDAVAMTTKLAGQGDAVPAVQPRPQPRARATRRTPTGTRPPTSGSGSGRGMPGWTSCTASSTSSGPTKGSVSARRAAEVVIFPRYHQWDAVLKLEADAKRQRRGPELPDPALGRVGQVQHHRLDGPPALHPPRRRGPARSSTRSW